MSCSPFLINGRQFTALLPLINELEFTAAKNYLFDLSYLSSLAVSGEKASDFLQGQLSCDLRQVNSNTIRQGAMCNLKGRVLALMDVVDWQGLQLVLPKDLIAATQFSLNKTAMLSRVKLEIKDSYQIYGFYLANPDDLLPENLPLPSQDLALSTNEQACCYSLGKQLFIILIKQDYAAALAQPFESKQQLRGSLAWHRLQLQAKTVEIYPDTRGLFLPHRIDLQLSGYLSFDKGCYKGQEIVARTHYRAKLKHRLDLFIIESAEAIQAGKKLFATTGGNTEVGELIDYCPLANKSYLIAASVLLDAPKEVLIEGQAEPVLLSTI
ncbi:tRNA-modifying protein YgfZ [Legionella massiliensis]|uniref:tRNA-modifying protein YgfZ n=1 Tax=Legionella massiliensis TaxID=1034943 RepID=A0A078KZ98_9GAMM|nr:glycine cleavage system protein T [Legionella massiliensis]CDZ78256.1 tRNA-modifying protein YgfZ [Legionella massiliensis]CEE13994.1 tRNA-modifying protein YgfZ [Legionella massiliensis]